MALYKYPQYISQSTDAAFDKEFTQGQAAPHSGVYRCMGCGREIAANANDPFPPQNHHQHSAEQGAIRWQLVVYAQGDPH